MKTLRTGITIAEVSNGTAKAIIVIDKDYNSKNFENGNIIQKRN